MSGPLWPHIDRTTWAFFGADAASLAKVVVELIVRRTTKFDHCIVRTYTEAVVALEAVAARQTTPSLEQCVVLGETTDDLVEGVLASGRLEFGSMRSWRIGVIPGVE